VSESRLLIPERYLYQDFNHKSPSVDPQRPGQVRVDLQMDVTVMRECRQCVVYIYYQCVSNKCSVSNVDLLAT